MKKWEAYVPRVMVASMLSLLLTSCEAVRTARLLAAYETTLADATPEDTTETEVTASTDAHGQPASILSAFFGLDDALPRNANQSVCEGAFQKDGMPIVFSHEIDKGSMQAGDFEVTTASGKVRDIHCVTLAPADDEGELRTALLVGHYGSVDDQPVEVEVVGNLLSLDGSINFKGQTATPIRLEAGPTIVLAETLTADELELGKAPTELPFGGGDGCPVGTKQAVRATWAGGVTKPGGDEADDDERLQYRVTVQRDDGAEDLVTPFALADLNDGDNNHLLCLDVEGTPTSVSFPAGFLTDPRDDPNPDTKRLLRGILDMGDADAEPTDGAEASRTGPAAGE